jgi:hypothetical protein
MRDKLTLKRLGILRKILYDVKYNCTRIPVWEEVIAVVDNQYITEYGIAERDGKDDRVLKDWGL